MPINPRFLRPKQNIAALYNPNGFGRDTNIYYIIKKMKKINIILACGINGELGANNELLWHIPEDLKYFKSLTKGKTVVMGRNTYESILNVLGKPLPLRESIVLSNSQTSDVEHPTVKFANTINKALEMASNEVFIIGGGKVYNHVLNTLESQIDTVYVSLVQKEYPQADSYVNMELFEGKNCVFRKF